MSSTIDNPATSETVNSAVNDVDSTDQVFQHILSKEEIVNELALLYVRKKLSFSALGAIAKSPNKVLAQVVRRISELENISELDQSIKNSVFNPENPVACVSTLKKNLKINSKKDSYYLCENGMAVKLVDLSDTCVSVRYFTRQRNLYTKPMKSKNIDIFKSDGLEAEVTVLAINSLQLAAKCWVLPMSKGCCVIPLLHHSRSSAMDLCNNNSDNMVCRTSECEAGVPSSNPLTV
ncbi:hypothetical protein OUZ56_018892 [Daphnia magna]|uniref:Uncharacterized protein n=1 Tax=Daphnia magna TaxID=35525 RepID=A0ABQ9ZA41_9CRUS|nr:hypothetical protein OUZ56_018892 [Daphnia magna]